MFMVVDYPGPLVSFERFEGVRFSVHTGIGTEEDPHRHVTYWFDEKGELIHSFDPCLPNPGAAK